MTKLSQQRGNRSQTKERLFFFCKGVKWSISQSTATRTRVHNRVFFFTNMKGNNREATNLSQGSKPTHNVESRGRWRHFHTTRAPSRNPRKRHACPRQDLAHGAALRVQHKVAHLSEGSPKAEHAIDESAQCPNKEGACPSQLAPCFDAPRTVHWLWRIETRNQWLYHQARARCKPDQIGVDPVLGFPCFCQSRKLDTNVGVRLATMAICDDLQTSIQAPPFSADATALYTPVDRKLDGGHKSRLNGRPHPQMRFDRGKGKRTRHWSSTGTKEVRSTTGSQKKLHLLHNNLGDKSENNVSRNWPLRAATLVDNTQVRALPHTMTPERPKHAIWVLMATTGGHTSTLRNFGLGPPTSLHTIQPSSTVSGFGPPIRAPTLRALETALETSRTRKRMRWKCFSCGRGRGEGRGGGGHERIWSEFVFWCKNKMWVSRTESKCGLRCSCRMVHQPTLFFSDPGPRNDHCPGENLFA